MEALKQSSGLMERGQVALYEDLGVELRGYIREVRQQKGHDPATVLRLLANLRIVEAAEVDILGGRGLILTDRARLRAV